MSRINLTNRPKNEGDEFTHNEFNSLINVVDDIDATAVRSVSLNGSDPILPDSNGMISIRLAQGDFDQTLSIKYNGQILTGDAKILSADGNITLGVQFKESSIVQNGNETSYNPTGNSVTLTVNSIGSSENTRLFSQNMRSVGHDSTEFVDVVLTDYLQDGEQTLQFVITNTANARPFTQIISIMKANLELRVQEDAGWYKEAKIVSEMTAGGNNPVINAQYYALGVVSENGSKDLHVVFALSDADADDELGVKCTVDVNNITTDSPTELVFARFEETVANNIDFFANNAVRTVKAWMTYTYGGQTISSNVLYNHVIVVANTSTATPMIAIQNKVVSANNYETTKLFDWNMYNPALVGTSTSTVTFLLTGENKTPVYVSYPVENVRNNVLYELSQNISIEASGNNLDLYTYASIDGTAVANDNYIAYIVIDNTNDFSAVSGADFYINPSVRNNQETNPARIINNADGSEITGCTFTNIAWRDGLDGWMTAGSRRVLRIAAGGRLTIPYSVYSRFTDTSSHHLTIELDMAVSNITNEDDPVITIGNADASNPHGLYLKPLSGGFFSEEQRSWSGAEVSWRENVRTHLVFNIQPNYTVSNPDTARVPNEPSTKTVSIIRAYINGVINKEYTYDPSSPSAINAGGNIVIGQDGCDIDIYNLRIYKDTNDKGNLNPNDVLRNYISTLPTGEDRLRVKAANDILVGGLINFRRCINSGYNCLVWHGQPVNKSMATSTKRYGYAEIYRFNADGTLDEQHSGKLYGIEMTGQGTTAMTYAEWNIQFKEDKKTGAGHDEYKYSDNGTLRNVFVDDEGTIGFGKTKFGYKLENGDPTSKKLVGKINYASSMQSHKMGACNLYNDLYQACVTSSITDFAHGERVAVKEEPFLYFVQRTEGQNDNLKVFQGLMTFGAGKADKPLWGVDDDDLKAGDCIIEGSYNNHPLTDARVPFVDNNTVTYSVKNEAFMYAGEKNLNFDYGDTADLHEGIGAWANVDQDDSDLSSEVPTTAQVKLWQPIWNFLYLTNVGIRPWTGTLDELNAAAESDSFDYQSAYWMNSNGTGYSRFDLYRCHYTKSGTNTIRTFVPAGIKLVQGNRTFYNFKTLYARTNADESTMPTAYFETDMWYDTDTPSGSRNIALNLLTALQEFNGVTINTNGVNSNDLNTRFKRELADVFATYADNNLYVNKKAVLFHHEFMTLVAGTDNRSKNTYYRLNPYANAVTANGETTYKPNMEMNGDDLDTIFKTNNAGIQSKPYYIEQHDIDENNSYYWDGQMNALNNTIEATYGRTLLGGTRQDQLQQMMNNIFTQMVLLNNDVNPSPRGCIEQYFFYIQRYFPAVAYNETARIRYEVPALFYMSEQPAQAPLSQSLGDQLESEAEYIKRRMIMLYGYAGYSGNESVKNIEFRGYYGQYRADIIPHYWLYPMSKITGGGSTIIPDRTNVRVPAKSTYNLNIGNNTAGQSVMLYFINELTEIGNMASWQTGQSSTEQSHSATIDFVSERLTKLECYGATAADVTFLIEKFDISGSPNVEVVDFHNCSTLQSAIGVANLMRLKRLDLRGTLVTSVGIPRTSNLTSVQLPDTTTNITVTYAPNLQTLTVDGCANITQIEIGSNIPVSAYQILADCYAANVNLTTPKLQSVKIYNVNWTNVSSNVLDWLCDIPTIDLTGRITMSNDLVNGAIYFNTKKKLIDRFGNIDDEDNPLYVSYGRISISSFTINGDNTFFNTGTEHAHQFYMVPDVSTHNNIVSYVWSTTAPEAWATLDQSGRVIANQLATSTDGSAGEYTLTCVMTLASGDTLTATLPLHFYERPAQVGDFVYHDGTYSDEYDRTKTLVGICFYSKQLSNGRWDRRMVGLSNIPAPNASREWGLKGTNGSDNGFPARTITFDDGTSKNPNAVGSGIMSTYSSSGLSAQMAGTNPYTGSSFSAGSTASSVTNYVLYENMVDPNSDVYNLHSYSSGSSSQRGINYVMSEKRYQQMVRKDDVNLPLNSAVMPVGMANTLDIIRWRNAVLSATSFTDVETNEVVDANLYRPSDLSMESVSTNRSSIILDAKNRFGDTALGDFYGGYLFPAASYCFAYKPTLDDPSTQTLNVKFDVNHWYLPAAGELMIFYLYDRVCNPNATSTKDNGTTVNLYHNGAPNVFGKAQNTGKYQRTTTERFFSSTITSRQSNYVNICTIAFASGNISSANPGAESPAYIRPCCMF